MSEKWEVLPTPEFGDWVVVDKNNQSNYVCVVGSNRDACRIAALPELEANYKEALGALQRCERLLSRFGFYNSSAHIAAKAALAKAEVNDD